MINHDNDDPENSIHEDSVDFLREQARTHGHSLLEMEPWSDFRGRSTLLMIDPPTVQWATISERNTLYLILEGPEARALPRDLREDLLRYGSLRSSAGTPFGNVETDLYVFTLEHLRNTLEGIGRRSLETRWSIRNAEPIEDPLHQQDELVSLSIRLPHDGLERIVRPLYLRSHASLQSLEVMTTTRDSSSLVAAGEAAGSLTRLACVMENGIHPPSRWLLPAASETELGRRIASWIDDLTPALANDKVAAHRVADGCQAVLHATDNVLRPEFGSAGWFIRTR